MSLSVLGAWGLSVVEPDGRHFLLTCVKYDPFLMVSYILTKFYGTTFIQKHHRPKNQAFISVCMLASLSAWSFSHISRVAELNFYANNFLL